MSRSATASGGEKIPTEGILAGVYRHRTILITTTVALVTTVLVIAPVAPILYQSLIDRPLYDSGQVLTLANYARLFQLRAFGEAALNSLLLATFGTIVAQTFGVMLAVILGRTNIPARSILGDVMLWPLYVSTLVLTFGWFIVYGSAGYLTLFIQSATGSPPWTLYSMTGMALVAGTSQVPLTILYCLGSTALADSTLEDAARSAGAGPVHTLRRITLPLMLPAIIYSAALNFTIILEMLSVPLILGEPAGKRFLTTLLYVAGLNSPRRDYGLVGTAATVLLAVVILLLIAQTWLLRNSRRFISVSGKAGRVKTFDLGALRWPLFAVVGIYALLFIALPIGAILLRSFVVVLTPLVPIWTLFTLDNFRDLAESEMFQRAIVNTLLLGIVGGAAATAFTALIALTIHRSEFVFRRQLEFVANIPRALPGMIAGIGFFYAMILLGPLSWLGPLWVLGIAYAVRHLPLGLGALSPSLFQISADLDRSARVTGADWWTASTRIVLRLMKPALLACFAVMFVHIIKEYTIAIFLFSPGSEVIGSTLISYWVNGHAGRVAALAAVQIVITFVFVYAVRRIFSVRIYG